MVDQFMKLKQSSPNLNKGFTLVELLVTTLIASAVLGMSLQLITDQRKQFVGDQLRSESNQTLRAGMDLIGTDARIAGDFLQSDSELPVVSVIDESAVTSPDNNGDILVFQRKMIPDTLRLCADLSAGTVLTVAKGPATSVEVGCGTYSDGNTNSFNDNVDAFRNHRCEADGNSVCDTTSAPSVGNCNDESVWAYIHNPVTKEGEFFQYAFESSSTSGGTTENQLHRCDSSTWNHVYTYDSTAPTNNPLIYILEERQYSLVGDILMLTENRNSTIEITNNVAEFQADVVTDSSTMNSFNPDLYEVTDWQSIKYLDVSMEATDTAESDVVTLKQSQRQISSKFFPRNVLSRD